jgi:hypothetical protein
VSVWSKLTAKPGYKVKSVFQHLCCFAAFCGLGLLIEEKAFSATPLQVTAWGYNFYGECNVPTNFDNAIAARPETISALPFAPIILWSLGATTISGKQMCRRV